jgi:cysteine desulfurase
MLPYFTKNYGNPSSATYALGWEAKSALEAARAHVAALINASPAEIVFTSGATEANNIILNSAARHNSNFVSTPIEHSSVINPLMELAERGLSVKLLSVDRLGRVAYDEIAELAPRQPTFVSIILANNEIGTVQDMSTISSICHERGFLLHTDATQAAGKIPLDVEEMGVDYLSLSAHKFHGPKGVGVLYIRKTPGRRKPFSLAFGGEQERGIRPGTENVPAIVAMGEAARICHEEFELNTARIRMVKEILQKNIVEGLERVIVNGDPDSSLPNTLNLTFLGIDAENLITKVPHICFSTGSACESGAGKASHILNAIGMTIEETRGTIRLAVSRFTTVDEVHIASAEIVHAVRSIRGE